MKYLIYITTIFCFSFNIQSQSLVDMYETLNSSTVVIQTQSNVSAGNGDKQKINTEEGLGSGVLVSEDGLIWTASHVVHTADIVEVKFTDGDIYNAEVINTNPIADLAAIKIVGDFQLKNKHVAIIGNSDEVRIGEDIFIIGSPLGIEQTLTKGIVSGKMSQGNLNDNFLPAEFIQTDAAINPGNSGGPMFNMKGEVIAIASFIMTETGGFNGIGFGASSNVAKKVLNEHKDIWSGMEFVFLQDDMAKAFNLPQKSGLLVLSVTDKGLGNKLGLRGGYIYAVIEENPLLIGGDVILEIAGIKLNSEEDLLLVIEKLEIFDNKKLTVKYLRNGKIESTSVKDYY